MRIPSAPYFSGVSLSIHAVFSLALLFAVSIPAAAEEPKAPKFTYEDFRYSVCVGSDLYSEEMQEMILKYLTAEKGGKAGKALHDDCAQDTMFSAMVRRSSSPDFLEKLLALGADPDYTGKTGYSARMTAVSLRRYQDVEPLLRGNIDFGRRNPAGDTLLMAAFANEDPETARNLLERNIPREVIDARGGDGNSILVKIARREIQFEANTVARLQELGADFNQLSAAGLTVLQEAMTEEGRLSFDREFIEALIKHGARVNAQNARKENALHFMTRYRMDKTLFDFLLEQSPDAGVSQQDENGNTPLLALFVNMPETRDYDRRPYVKKLLELNSDVNAVNKEGLPVLAAAIMAGAQVFGSRGGDFVADLMKAGASADMEALTGHSMLYYAALGRFGSDAVKAILETRPDLNAIDRETGAPPLVMAILAENEVLASRLIEGGADVNLADREGRTPLMALAFHMPDLNLLRRLIRAGADIRAKDRQGRIAADYLEDSFYSIDPRYQDKLEEMRRILTGEKNI